MSIVDSSPTNRGVSLTHIRYEQVPDALLILGLNQVNAKPKLITPKIFVINRFLFIIIDELMIFIF